VWGTFLAFLALLSTCFNAGFFLGLFFDPKDGGDIILRNIGLIFSGLFCVIFQKMETLVDDLLSFLSVGATEYCLVAVGLH
jgi:hypothetical protein